MEKILLKNTPKDLCAQWVLFNKIQIELDFIGEKKTTW